MRPRVFTCWLPALSCWQLDPVISWGEPTVAAVQKVTPHILWFGTSLKSGSENGRGDRDHNNGPVSVSRQIFSVSTFLGLQRTIVKQISQRPRTLARQWETPVRRLREDPGLHTRFGTPGIRWWRQDCELAGVNSRRQFWCSYEPYVFIFSDTSVHHGLLECTMMRRLPMQNFIPLVTTLTGGCKVNSGYQQNYEAFTIWKCS